jgi:cytidylate kinase
MKVKIRVESKARLTVASELEDVSIVDIIGSGKTVVAIVNARKASQLFELGKTYQETSEESALSFIEQSKPVEAEKTEESPNATKKAEPRKGK